MNPAMLLLIIGVIFIIAVIMILLGMRSGEPEKLIEERIDIYASRAPIQSLEELELAQPFSERVIKPLIRGSARLINRISPQRNVENLRLKLERAGRPNNWGPAEFMGVRGLAAAAGAILPLILLTISGAPITNRLLFSAVLGAFGFFAPVMWLNGRIKKRQSEIIKSLPDALDLLTISVEAGLGFDAAMSKVAEKWDNELSKAFERVIHEIRIGKTRREALRSMAENVDVPDVTSFVASIIQADQLGVSIAKVLRIQSEQMRVKRRQRAEEKAHQAPVKMIIPMVFLIFPSIWVVLLGPSILILLHSGLFKGG
ncbi:MAG: type II secretion system F family protein [Anaerolineae bacterium]